jgi:hypothetical protein
MKVGGTLKSEKSSAGKSYTLIVAIPTGFQQSKLRDEVPERYLRRRFTNKNGVPEVSGTPSHSISARG